MKHADTAMYAAKLEGKGAYRFFRLAMTEQAALRMQIEAELRRAVEEGQLELHYQPQIDLADGRIVRCEALLRWRHPRRGLVMPEDFIPLAEETGLIDGLGGWALEEACRRLAAWQQGGIAAGVAVNIAARQLQAGDLPRRIAALVQEYGIRPDGLQIEVSENVLMADPEQHVAALRRLREMGVTVAIDDFGSGFSNLPYLCRLPVGLLKIGCGLVGRVPGDEEETRAIRAIADLGRSLGVEVVAEGVESEAQAEFLRRAGCRFAQGLVFARPEPASTVESRLARGLS